MAWKYNDRVIRVGRSWQDDDGITHPTNWANWSDEEKAAAGLIWEADPAAYDDRFYWDANTPKNINDVNEVDENSNPVLDAKGNQVVTLGLKSVWKAIIKQQAAGMLSSTDWYVTRNAETGAAIPADVTTYRAAVRSKSNEIETAIDAVTTHAAFVELMSTPIDWPEEV